MKRWTVAAVVAVALALVGVPAAALALSSHGSQAARPAATSSSHASPSASGGTKSPWWQHHRGDAKLHQKLKRFGHRHGATPGMPFGHRKLTQAQRDQLADRFDAGAKRLQEAARCLRAETGSTALRTCLSKTFPHHPGLGHGWHGGPSAGPSGKASGGVSLQPRQG